MSDARRLRLRGEGGQQTKGDPTRGAQRKARNRLGSVSCSNEESTEGEEDPVGGCPRKKTSANRKHAEHHPPPRDPAQNGDRGLKPGFRRAVHSNGLSKSSRAEEDIIDGFVILSFSTFQELEFETKGSLPDPGLLSDDALPDGVPPQHLPEDEETKDEEGGGGEAEIRRGDEGLDPTPRKVRPVVLVANGLTEKEGVGENNNEPTTPNQNFVGISAPKHDERRQMVQVKVSVCDISNQQQVKNFGAQYHGPDLLALLILEDSQQL